MPNCTYNGLFVIFIRYNFSFLITMKMTGLWLGRVSLISIPSDKSSHDNNNIRQVKSPIVLSTLHSCKYKYAGAALVLVSAFI